MNKFLLFLFFVMPAMLFAADEIFVDCGSGYVMASVPNRHGISTVECRILWCRDLENGRIMGRDSEPSSGYEKGLEKNVAGSECGDDGFLCDGITEPIKCFGRRRWCPGEVAGEWDPELGFYTRRGADPSLYRSVLGGSCYRWQLQPHNCGAGEVGFNDGSTWVCGKPGNGGDGSRAAIRAQAVRRNAVMTAPRR